MKSLFRKVFRDLCIRKNTAKLSNKPVRLPLQDHKEGKEERKERFLTYIFTRYVNLVKSYEETFPTAAKFYNRFSAGIKLFKDDGLLLFKAYKKSNLDGLQYLTRRELEIFHEMPRNMIKVAPIIVIGTTVPFGAAIFALGCMFPKKMLSHHFWSEEQKQQFNLMDHKSKVENYKPIVSCMRSRLKFVKESYLKCQIATVLEDLQKGINPHVNTILRCKPLFEQSPYSIQHLGSIHISLLLRLHNLHRGWRRKMRLKEFASLIKAMDSAIVKEGGLQALTVNELKWASFFRGLNPTDMEINDVIAWLQNWLLISREVDEKSYSLLLHCPVLLSCNAPTNLLLLK